MVYLFLAIFFNVVISAIFKVIPRYNINTFQAIVVNYCVCVITGLLFIGHFPGANETVHTSWFPWALMTGLLFISIFYLLGHSMKVDGITTTIIANKLSLVIPAVFSIIVYKEAAGIGKVAGILLAFPAIFLTAHVKGENGKPQNLLLPVMIFLGGGVLDTLMKYIQLHFLDSTSSQALFAIFCFASAGSIGLLISIFLLALKKTVFHWKNVAAGIIIGIPNYFSIYYLIRMLNSNFLKSSAMIPVFNIAILVASSITALLFFREKLNTYRVFGLLLSVIAILLIAFGDKNP
jgi:drug/metabolite transporter (DMT)-like permease